MTSKETLTKYVTDIRAAEHQLLHTLKAQENDSDLTDFPAARELIKRIHQTMERHLSALDTQAEWTGETIHHTVKDTVTAVTGSLLGSVSHLRTHKVSKMLRDDYATLSLTAVGYSMLHTTGIALNSESVATLALAHLRDIAGLIVELSQAVVPVVVAELAESNVVDASASSLAAKNIWSAWRGA